MKTEIRLLQHMKHPNDYRNIPGNYRSFRIADGQVICRWCNRVGHFARAWPANDEKHVNKISTQLCSSNTLQYLQSSYIPNHNSRALYKTDDERHNIMTYHYPQDSIYTYPLRKTPFLPANQIGNRYQARRSNISSQHNNHSSVIQNHSLQEHSHQTEENFDKISKLDFL